MYIIRYFFECLNYRNDYRQGLNAKTIIINREWLHTSKCVDMSPIIKFHSISELYDVYYSNIKKRNLICSNYKVVNYM